MCTAAYREALTRDLSSTASSAPASTLAPDQRHATEAGREGVAGRPVRPPTHPRQNDLERRGERDGRIVTAELGASAADRLE
jgi:hypothetical protein